MRPTIGAQLFPWPFVGVVVLLVVLIFLTPNLVTSPAPAAGSLVTQAELLVDRTPTGNATHFYVEGLGNVRYAEIRWAVATNVSWPPPISVRNVTWTSEANVTESLIATFESGANPVAVNVSATYVDYAGNAVRYVGAFAFYLADGLLSTAPLLGGLSGEGPTALSALPLVLLLATASPGAP